ncbi:MAG: biosynthetic-type acetolactate synthase large subunit [Spirochaetales bacterium]|nr:biosynthetic-type acetolactate synthase large subunit [Spirochaetales bacterium]
MNRSGAEMILEAFRQEHIDTLFGYPGGAVIPLFDAFHDARDMRLIMTRHEQAAVHAADGYARATGKPGVCVVTSGPGATNTITGLATAKMDSVPLVCLCGQVTRSLIGNDAFQEVDTLGITQPVTKHNFIVSDRKDLPRILKEAFYIASSGRPGPVVVDIPKDIQLERLDDSYPADVHIRGYRPEPEVSAASVHQLMEALRSARKPLFFIGGGMVIAGASELFARLIERLGVPFVTSLMGIGVLDSRHPLNLGMIGMHGAIAANKAVTECDLLVALGVRFADRSTGNTERFAPHARIAQVDIDPTSIGKNVRVDIPVLGNLRAVLERMLYEAAPLDIPAWLQMTGEFQAYEMRVQHQHSQTGAKEDTDVRLPTPREVLEVVQEEFPDAAFATEVGQNQMWAAQYLRISRPRSWFTSGGLGTMGYGLPAAIGVHAAFPNRHTVVIAGDGSIQMNIQELATLVQENLPIIVVILDNGYLGMVRQWQELFTDGRYMSTCLSTSKGCGRTCRPGTVCTQPRIDFAAIARAYGAEGFSVSNLAALREACQHARTSGKPAVIDCAIDREINVWPIVAPGSGLDQMLYQGVRI